MAENTLRPYSPSEWEFGRLQGSLETQINNLQNEIQTLTNTTEGQEIRIQNLEKEVDKQKTKLIMLIAGISTAISVGIENALPFFDKIITIINKGGN